MKHCAGLLFLFMCQIKALCYQYNDSMPAAWIYADMHGQNIIPSLNVEYNFAKVKKIKPCISVGAAIPGYPSEYKKISGANMSAFILRPIKKRYWIEAGAGYGVCKSLSKKGNYFESGYINGSFVSREFSGSEKRLHTYAFVKIGIRVISKDNRFFAKVYTMPLVGLRQTIYPIADSYFMAKTQASFKPVLLFNNVVSIWGGASIGYRFYGKKGGDN
ncbi:MAG: hypothetical protein K1X81_06680 [Bacteroidia bacterium]|nr:hypothetical protein [Bacteroidia bacterium]